MPISHYMIQLLQDLLDAHLRAAAGRAALDPVIGGKFAQQVKSETLDSKLLQQPSLSGYLWVKVCLHPRVVWLLQLGQSKSFTASQRAL